MKDPICSLLRLDLLYFFVTISGTTLSDYFNIEGSLLVHRYARNTRGSICQYKEDGLVSRPPSLFTSMRRPMQGTSGSCPKSQLKSTWLTAKSGSFLDHMETGKKGQNVISSSVQYPMWILLTKPMQTSVITVCLHCSFARLKNKHIGVLGTNVATISWLHWSPVSGYSTPRKDKKRSHPRTASPFFFFFFRVRRFSDLGDQ